VVNAAPLGVVIWIEVLTTTFVRAVNHEYSDNRVNSCRVKLVKTWETCESQRKSKIYAEDMRSARGQGKARYPNMREPHGIHVVRVSTVSRS
jgi:hypothetical protein